MAARKKSAAKKVEPERSVTGAELVNGRPFFTVYNGVRMNRTEYLAASRAERKAAVVEELRAAAGDSD
jgi:hypothetical protein